MDLNWRKGSAWRLSPRLSEWQRKIVAEMKTRVPSVREHLWLLSSGTQSVNEVKAICQSFAALETSAAAVNQHLAVSRHDRWLLTLPTYHVGGLSILVRAEQTKSKVFPLLKWEPREFAATCAQHKISLVSLVPTQVHDLVALGLRAPPAMRAIVVGGGSLSPELYRSARELSWPLLTSYGLTECCSQVATAALDSDYAYPDLQILPHVEVDLRDQRIFLRSESIARWIARGTRDGQFSLEDPRRAGWMPTEDLAERVGDRLKILGRRDDVVKVLGVLVAINQVEHEAAAHFAKLGGDLAVVAVRGGREENRLVLVTDSRASLCDLERSLQAFNAQTPGPHRLSQFVWIEKIPRGELGKVKRASLLDSLRLC